MCGIYYRLKLPLRASSIENPFYVWTSISAARQLILLGVDRRFVQDMRFECLRILGFPTTHATPARPNVPVIHPRMTDNNLIDRDSMQ